jgi:GNAT superfamily N-acetyltransferase
MVRPHVLTRPHAGLVPQRRAGAARPAPSEPTVRRRSGRELAAAARLLRLVHYDGPYPVHWPDAPRAWLDHEGVTGAWVAERLGELLGHVAISQVGLDEVSGERWREMTGRDPATLGAVTRLFVRPSARGRGIGTTLLDVAVEGIRAGGRLPVLEVVSVSREAIGLFEGQGWRLLDVRSWGDRTSTMRLYCFALPGPGPH